MRAGSGPVVDNNDVMNASSPLPYERTQSPGPDCESVSRCVLKRGDLHAYVGGPLPPRVTDSSSTRYSHRATRGIVERFGKLLASQHTRKAMVFSLSLSSSALLPSLRA